ncbi:hypothetical protein BTHI11S_00856 [Bosea thiooxidans]
MVVDQVPADLIIVGPGLARRRAGGLDDEAAAHAQMHDQRLAVVEIRDQVFGAPRQRLDAPPRQPLGEPFRQRKAQIGPTLLDAGEALARHGGLQPAPDGLDLG